MKYRANVSISYGSETHDPGDVADLAGWPVDDLARFEAEGIITRLPDPPASKPSRKAETPKESEHGN
jgi:hypothetical protein